MPPFISYDSISNKLIISNPTAGNYTITVVLTDSQNAKTSNY